MPQNSMAGQQRLQISELQFDKFTTPPSCMYWKIRFKNQVSSCSDFSSDAVLWIKEVEMVHSVDEFKSSRSVCGKDFPKFEMLDAKIASALNKIIQNSQFKRRISLEEQKAQKEDRFLRGRQIACMIYDHFRVTGAHDEVLVYVVLFSLTLRNDNVQDFDTWWDEILWPRSHRMMFRKVCTNWEYASLINSKPHWNCLTWKFIKRYRCPIIGSWRRWWKEAWIRNFDHEIFTPETRKLRQEQWLRVTGDYHLSENDY